MRKFTTYRVDADDFCIDPNRIDEVWSLLSSHIPEEDHPFENQRGKRVIPLKWLGNIRGNQATLHDIDEMDTYLHAVIYIARAKWTNAPPQLFDQAGVNGGFQNAVLSSLVQAERILNSYLEEFRERAALAPEHNRMSPSQPMTQITECSMLHQPIPAIGVAAASNIRQNRLGSIVRSSTPSRRNASISEAGNQTTLSRPLREPH
jgi:hypothetical protein